MPLSMLSKFIDNGKVLVFPVVPSSTVPFVAAGWPIAALLVGGLEK